MLNHWNYFPLLQDVSKGTQIVKWKEFTITSQLSRISTQQSYYESQVTGKTEENHERFQSRLLTIKPLSTEVTTALPLRQYPRWKHSNFTSSPVSQSRRRPEFKPRLIHVGFVVGKVTPKEVFPPNSAPCCCPANYYFVSGSILLPSERCTAYWIQAAVPQV